MRIFIRFAVDIPIAVGIVLTGHFPLLNLLILGLCALIHINHLFSVDLAERQARALAVAETDEPVTRIAVSLEPRRLRDYTNRNLEWVLALSSMIAFAWLVRSCIAAPEHRNLRVVFEVPAVFLYLQFGMLIVKCTVVAWPTPVPHVQTAEHMEARAETRRYYLTVCDGYRATAAAAIAFWPIQMTASPAGLGRLVSVWCATWVVIGVLATVWVEIKRRQLVTLALRARPLQLPDLWHQSEIARWPVCFQPSAPVLMLKGAHGYSLNLANTLAQFSAAYLVGFAGLMVVLRMAR
jgi:hypothetical protein